ncbi:MAG: hypothetical protein WBA39_04180 [Rivularia sp. (in: cyanobacteria)]
MALSSSATKINGGLLEKEVGLVPDMSCVLQNTIICKAESQSIQRARNLDNYTLDTSRLFTAFIFACYCAIAALFAINSFLVETL